MTKNTPKDYRAELEAIENAPPDSLELAHYLRKIPPNVEELTAKEVAVVIGWSNPNLVYQLCEEGKIGYFARGSKAHRNYYFPRASVIKYLREMCNKELS